MKPRNLFKLNAKDKSPQALLITKRLSSSRGYADLFAIILLAASALTAGNLALNINKTNPNASNVSKIADTEKRCSCDYSQGTPVLGGGRLCKNSGGLVPGISCDETSPNCINGFCQPNKTVIPAPGTGGSGQAPAPGTGGSGQAPAPGQGGGGGSTGGGSGGNTGGGTGGSTQPKPAGNGYCGDANYNPAQGQKRCELNNANFEEQYSFPKYNYCQKTFGNTYAYWYSCAAVERGQRELCGGKLDISQNPQGYVAPICIKSEPTASNWATGRFEASKAKTAAYEDAKYFDVFSCQGGTVDFAPVDHSKATSEACNSYPWTQDEKGSLPTPPDGTTCDVDKDKPYWNDSTKKCEPRPWACPNTVAGKANVCQQNACGVNIPNLESGVNSSEANALCKQEGLGNFCCGKPAAGGGVGSGTDGAATTCLNLGNETEVRFDWKPVDTTSSYLIKWMPGNPSGTQVTHLQSSINPQLNSFIKDGFIKGKQYSWSIDSLNSSGGVSAILSSGTFTVPSSCASGGGGQTGGIQRDGICTISQGCGNNLKCLPLNPGAGTGICCNDGETVTGGKCTANPGGGQTGGKGEGTTCNDVGSSAPTQCDSGLTCVADGGGVGRCCANGKVWDKSLQKCVAPGSGSTIKDGTLCSSDSACGSGKSCNNAWDNVNYKYCCPVGKQWCVGNKAPQTCVSTEAECLRFSSSPGTGQNPGTGGGGSGSMPPNFFAGGTCDSQYFTCEATSSCPSGKRTSTARPQDNEACRLADSTKPVCCLKPEFAALSASSRIASEVDSSCSSNIECVNKKLGNACVFYSGSAFGVCKQN